MTTESPDLGLMSPKDSVFLLTMPELFLNMQIVVSAFN